MGEELCGELCYKGNGEGVGQIAYGAFFCENLGTDTKSQQMSNLKAYIACPHHAQGPVSGLQPL